VREQRGAIPDEKGSVRPFVAAKVAHRHRSAGQGHDVGVDRVRAIAFVVAVRPIA
jgi:hypothetical protein